MLPAIAALTSAPSPAMAKRVLDGLGGGGGHLKKDSGAAGASFREPNPVPRAPAAPPAVEDASAIELAMPGAGGPGSEVRFLKPDVAAEAAATKSALASLGPDKSLACPIIGAFPLGRPFLATSAPVTLKVTTSREREKKRRENEREESAETCY